MVQMQIEQYGQMCLNTVNYGQMLLNMVCISSIPLPQPDPEGAGNHMRPRVQHYGLSKGKLKVHGNHLFY